MSKLCAAAVAAILMSAAMPASAAVFVGSRSVGTATVDFSITTDKVGVLLGYDISAFSITLKDGGTTFSFNNTSGQVLIGGNALTVNAAGLFFDFGLAESYVLFQAPTIGAGSTFWCLQAATAYCYSSRFAGEAIEADSDYVFPSALRSGNVQIGGTGNVPEPASWAMMVGGFGLIGAAMRRRQKVAVTFA